MTLGALTRRDSAEWLDDAALVANDLPGNLRDIRLLNRWFGGRAIALHYLRPYLAGNRSFSLLDVATGSADIPAAIATRAARRGLAVTATGLDVSPLVLSEAARVTSRLGVHLVQGDARDMQWPDRSFDVVTCFLALHHFSPADAVKVLREMWRLTSSLLVVADLRRTYAAYAGTWLATHTVTRNRVTRHDGPLSVLRAYTPAELTSLAGEAGLCGIGLHIHHPFRQALTAQRGPGA